MQWNNQDAASRECFGLTGVSRTLMTMLVIAYGQAVLSLWYVNKHCDGSFETFYEQRMGGNVLYDAWTVLTAGFIPFGAIGARAWTFLAYFFTCAIGLLHLPGETVEGPVTPSGHVPQYIDNGFKAFFAHIALFAAGAQLGLFPLTVVYDDLGDILNALNYGALAFVVFLYFKSVAFPSTADVSSYGNVLMDCFWGRELYPRLFNIDVKQLTNCRFGMVYWAVATLSCACKAAELNGGVLPFSVAVSALLQMIYITKFFWWEAGYMRSMDIQQDHAGYYLCWGCLVYVPSMYTSMSVYMVTHNSFLEGQSGWAAAAFLAGIAMVWLNYDIDNQRAVFRQTQGKARIWGSLPQYIEAKYTTADNHERTSLLLLSGWWGLARHFHYVPEVLAAFVWSATAGFDHAMPFLYVAYLVILLVNRSHRDDSRCAAKYGSYWNIYTKKVPYRIVPGVY